ncbi:VOC family protein [Aquibaculum sediminis]|uniref:VOC family protein n=1 Tax=Aquibaculum sediminis TaxID=3231907 RepID=UPI003456A54A
MKPVITAFDHVLVGVGDLEAGRINWERLGFTACPRGRHIGWGTANYCLMFQNDYVELLGIVDPSQFTNNLDRFLEERSEGLLAGAYRSSDIDGDVAELRRRGLTVDGPKDLARIIEHPDGELRPRFRLMHFDPASRPGFLAFASQHLTPEMVWQAPWMEHANGARAITGFLAVAEDLEAAERAGVAWFGDEQVQRAGDSLTMRAGELTLELVTPAAAAGRFGARLPAGFEGGPLGFTVAVADLARCRELLQSRGVDFDEVDGEVRLPAAEANGVLLTFVEE